MHETRNLHPDGRVASSGDRIAQMCDNEKYKEVAFSYANLISDPFEYVPLNSFNQRHKKTSHHLPKPARHSSSNSRLKLYA